MKIVKIMFDGCYTDKGERIEHDAKTWGIFEAGLRGYWGWKLFRIGFSKRGVVC